MSTDPLTRFLTRFDRWKAIHEVLEYAYESGRPVSIYVASGGVYEDCDVTSVDCTTDGGVDFTVFHQTTNRQYETRADFAEIEKVVVI